MSPRRLFPSLLYWLDRLHWLWLALAAPFLLFPSPKRSLALLVVPGLWLLRLIVIRHPLSATRNPQPSLVTRHSPLPYTPLNAALLMMALMVLVSEWATFDLAYSLPKISGMVLGLGVFFAVAREGERVRGWWSSLLAFLGVGLGIAVLGVIGTRWATTKIAFLAPIVDRLPKLIAGLQGAESGFHPNEVAGALIWVLPVMLAVSVALIGVIASRRCTFGGVAIPFSRGKTLLNGRLLREKRPRNDYTELSIVSCTLTT